MAKMAANQDERDAWFAEIYMKRNFAVKHEDRLDNGVDIRDHDIDDQFYSRLLKWLHREFSSGEMIA